MNDDHEMLFKALKALGDVSRTEVQQMYTAGKLFRAHFAPKMRGMGGADAKAKWAVLLAEAEQIANKLVGKAKCVTECLDVREVCRLLGQDCDSLAKLEVRSHELRPFATFLRNYSPANGFDRGWRVPGLKPEETTDINLDVQAAMVRAFERLTTGQIHGETAVMAAIKEEIARETETALAACDEHDRKAFLLDQEAKGVAKEKAAKARAKQKAEEAGFTVGKALTDADIARMLLDGQKRADILMALAKVAGMAGLAAVSDDIERLAGLIEQAERKAPQTRELAVA